MKNNDTQTRLQSPAPLSRRVRGPIQAALYRPIILAVAVALAGSAFAQDAAPAPEVIASSEDRLSTTVTADAAARTAAAPSQNVTVNLINRMVEKGLLSKEDSVDLIKQAEADAAMAQEQAQAVQAAVQQIASVQSAPTDSFIPPSQPDPSLQPMEMPAPYPGPDDTMRVSYIPESVKAEMREQITADVLAQYREDTSDSPRSLPEWVTRYRLLGDFRIRNQNDSFSSTNDNTGSFPNFNAINTGAPFDVSGTVFSPQLNVDQDRNRFRIRVRFGAEITLRDNFTAGIRIGTGENSSPVSQNQTLGGTTNGQGGNFSKYAIWLDRGFLRYDFSGVPDLSLSVTAGRFDNPFFATTILWANDLAFDGFVLKGKYSLADGDVTPFVTVGAFPIFNTDFNYSSNQPAKFESRDKWLYAAQVGLDWKIAKDFTAKMAVAYLDYDNIEGELSDPFTPLNASDQGNTDASRPSFAQKGNTYFAIRNIVPNASNNFGTTNQFQYFGLASKFTQVTLTGKLDYSRFEPFHVILSGEYVKNTAFDEQDIESKAVNNRGPAATGTGKFEGGDTAWIVNLRLGSPALEKRWDWAIDLNYRHVESDAVVDGFADSDFGGGGSNVQGYTLGGLLALSPDVNFGIRWMSANEIAGPPLKSDVLQIDLNSRF
jgi:hypothetical protein